MAPRTHSPRGRFGSGQARETARCGQGLIVSLHLSPWGAKVHLGLSLTLFYLPLQDLSEGPPNCVAVRKCCDLGQVTLPLRVYVLGPEMGQCAGSSCREHGMPSGRSSSLLREGKAAKGGTGARPFFLGMPKSGCLLAS